MLSPVEQATLQDTLADLAEEAKKCVRGGHDYRATIILRATHLPDGDVVVSDDHQDKVLEVVSQRWPK